jgi:hypothetical protein
VTPLVGDAVQLRLIDELEAAIAARFEGGCGGGGFTIRETVAVCDRLPLVPVIVTVLFPLGVAPVVATVSVEEPDALIDVGLKLEVAPAGRPLAPSPTVPVNPFCAVIVTV